MPCAASLDSVETDSTAATSNGAALGSQLAGMVALVTTVGQMLWLHRAVAGARVLGLRGRRSPGWTAAGWIIPIVNYWWPYQDVGSMFPEGERPTRQLRGWWALHVLSLPLLVIAVVGVVAGGPLVLWAPLAVLPPIGAAVLIARAHRPGPRHPPRRSPPRWPRGTRRPPPPAGNELNRSRGLRPRPPSPSGALGFAPPARFTSRRGPRSRPCGGP